MSNEFDRELFERAFSAHIHSCRRKCNCGIEYWDGENDGYTWEEGEIEELEKNPKAVCLPHSVSMMNINGKIVVADCNCWLEQAKGIAGWLDQNDQQVAAWLNMRRKKALAIANALPEVKL